MRSDAPDPVTITITQVQPGNGNVIVITSTNPPMAIPTLVYNCAFMPFICRNVANYMQAQGETFTNGLYELVADVQSKAASRRTEERKAHTCGATASTWSRGRGTEQCADVSLREGIGQLHSDRIPNIPAISTQGRDGYIAAILVNDQLQDAGLIWSCDEFPSSS